MPVLPVLPVLPQSVLTSSLLGALFLRCEFLLLFDRRWIVISSYHKAA